MSSAHITRCGLLAATLLAAGCSMEAMKVSMDATETASAVFKQARDEARIERDAKASRRLGQLCGSGELSTAEVQPLKRIVAGAKSDGRVTIEEADQILVEMERIVSLHR